MPTVLSAHKTSILSIFSILCAIVLSVAGCGPFGLAEAPVGQAQVAPGTTSKARYVVQRGTITGAVRAPGRLAPGAEMPLSFRVAGKLGAIHVATGSQVKQGDLVAELDSGPISRQVEEAGMNYNVAALRLEQARLKSVGDQDVLIARTNVDRADADLCRAREHLTSVRAGPPPADVRAAELAASTAALARDEAAARLASARRGPSPEEVNAARATTERARLAAAAAEADRAAAGALVERGLAPEVVALANARAEYEKARLAYQARIEPTPTPVAMIDPIRIRTLEAEVMAAEAAVERARRDHTAAEVEQLPRRTPATPAVPNRIQEAKHTMQKADVDLEVARRRVDLARAGKLPSDAPAVQLRSAAEVAAEVAAARAPMEQAKWALDQAEVAASAAAQRGTALSAPEVAAADAGLASQVAQETLARLQAGAAPEDLAYLERATALAQVAYETAAARVEALRVPSAREVREAQEAVDRATADLQLARAEYAARQAQIPTRRSELTLDVKVLEQQAELAGYTLQTARGALEGTRLFAPADGTVVAIQKKGLDAVAEGEVVVVLADMGNVLVNADVAEAQVGALTAGQPATVVLPAPLGHRLPAAVVEVGTTPLVQEGGNAIRVTLRLQELAPGLRPGQANEVLFEGLTRDGALLLPKSAVRTVGSRRSVLIADRDREREVEIRTGLVSADGAEVEVVAGLREGDSVVLPPTLTTTG